MTTLRRRGAGIWNLRSLRRIFSPLLVCLAVGYFLLSATKAMSLTTIYTHMQTAAFPLTTALRWELEGPSFSWPTLATLLPLPTLAEKPVTPPDELTAQNPTQTPSSQKPFTKNGAKRAGAARAESPKPSSTPSPQPGAQTGEPGQATIVLPSETPREVNFQPSSTTGYAVSGGVYIKNESGLSVDVSKLLSQELPFSLPRSQPSVLIIHTHATESFWPDEMYPYTPVDVERTEDKDLNVVRLGDTLTKILAEKGITVLHDRNIYDYPSYTGSYSRALTAIETYMKKYPSIQVVLDIHRDSIVGADGVTCKPVSETPDGKAAQMMLVVGTDGGSLPHDGWRQNAALAAKLQKRLDEQYPTLMRPINLRKERFNQHATPGSLILEVGASGNTLGEALTSIEIFGDVAGELLAGYLTDG